MRVLVAYASRHGATKGIAEKAAETISSTGLQTDIRPAAEVRSLSEYDAFVIGSAAYMFHWLKPASRLVRQNASILSSKPVWLFSSGPLGTDLVDEKGIDIFESSAPKEFEDFEPLIQPRGKKVFFGAWDNKYSSVGLAERLFRALPASKKILPNGDFRDWESITTWGAEIAAELKAGDR